MQYPPKARKQNLVAFYYFAWLAAIAALLVLYVAWAVRTVPEQSAKPTRSSANTTSPAEPYTPVVDIPSFDPSQQDFILLAWSTQGMHMVADAEPVWTLLPPGNELRAQLIRRGPQPGLVTEDVTIIYRVEKEQSEQDGKPSARASGVMLLEPGGNTFAADGIDILPYRTSGGFNAYPTVTVEARDAATGNVMARSIAVLPVSTEVGCRRCHGGEWKYDDLAGISATTADAVLAVHDRRNSTKLAEQAARGETVVCRSCHSGESEAPGPNLSAAIHGWHANYMSGNTGETCGQCHPSDKQGPTRFYRGIHAWKALDCTRCHGTMNDHALSLLRWEVQTGRKGMEKLMVNLRPYGVANVDDIKPRAPWVMEPACTGCHDFKKRPSPATANAFNKWTPDAKELFTARKDDMDALRCPTCHGSPHALYTANNPFARDLDNMPPLQYQKLATVMGGGDNCIVCHREALPMEASAHHPVVILDTIPVTIPDGAVLTRPAVRFPHSGHVSVDCGTCHHMGFQPEGQLCSNKGCHDKPRPEENTTADSTDKTGDYAYFRNAFHGAERGCMPCHMARHSEGKAAGPVRCRNCHIPKPGA